MVQAQRQRRPVSGHRNRHCAQAPAYMATSATIRRIDLFGIASKQSTAPTDLSSLALEIVGNKVVIGEEAPTGSLARGVAEILPLAVPLEPDDDAATWINSGQASELRAFADILFVVTYAADVPDPSEWKV
jgi:hypothetical protein